VGPSKRCVKTAGRAIVIGRLAGSFLCVFLIGVIGVAIAGEYITAIGVSSTLSSPAARTKASNAC
jgi:hypothetical protein